MISCFFCQTLLSDYIEGVLPSLRATELKAHLNSCKLCSRHMTDLRTSLEILAAIPPHPISHDLALEISAVVGRSTGTRLHLVLRTKTRIAVGAAALIAVSALYLSAPLFEQAARESELPRFVRYHPLQHGADEIVEEHVSWLQVRDPAMRSMWEEGGLSPEDFEKTFGPRSIASDSTD